MKCPRTDCESLPESCPDKIDETRSLLAGLVEPTRKEPGCASYELLQNRADPTDFTFVEEWESEAAINAHFSTDHVRAALAKVTALLAAPPDIRQYSKVR